MKLNIQICDDFEKLVDSSLYDDIFQHIYEIYESSLDANSINSSYIQLSNSKYKTKCVILEITNVCVLCINQDIFLKLELHIQLDSVNIVECRKISLDDYLDFYNQN